MIPSLNKKNFATPYKLNYMISNGLYRGEKKDVEIGQGRSAILGGHFFQFVRIGWVESKNGCPQP